MSTIHTAVLGYGLGGRVFHAPFVAAVPGLELTGIMQRNGDTAAQAYPQARIYRDPEDVFTDRQIDLVVVSTPNETHFSLAARALRAGKHVVIDKPFATTSAQALELIEIANAAGKLVAPFHNRRYDGDFLTMRKLLGAGTLGRVVTVESRFDRFRPLQRPNSWKETGGFVNGLLSDLGPHLVDQALALFGLPEAITASVRSDRDQTEIDDAFDIVLHYKNDDGRPFRYSCHATMLCADEGSRFALHGTHGSYRKFGVDPQEAALVAGARPPRLGDAAPWLDEPETAWGTLTVAANRTEPVTISRAPYPTERGDYRAFYANVRDAILGSGPLAISAEDGCRVIRLLELARDSSERQATLPVTFD